MVKDMYKKNNMTRMHFRWISWLFISFMCIYTAPIHSQGASALSEVSGNNENAKLATLMNKLTSANLRQTEALVSEISLVSHPKVREILVLMLNGDLYYIKRDKTLVAARKSGKQYELTEVLTGVKLPNVKKSKIRKVRTNNRLRSQIRTAVAELDLASQNKDLRIQAVKQLLENPSESGLAAIKKQLEKEQSADVAELMSTVLLLNQLKTGAHQAQLNAVEELKSSLQPEVRNTFVYLLREKKQG